MREDKGDKIDDKHARQKIADRRCQKREDRKLNIGEKRQKNRRWKIEDRRSKTDDRGQKIEDRRQKIEGRRLKIEDRENREDRRSKIDTR